MDNISLLLNYSSSCAPLLWTQLNNVTLKFVTKYSCDVYHTSWSAIQSEANLVSHINVITNYWRWKSSAHYREMKENANNLFQSKCHSLGDLALKVFHHFYMKLSMNWMPLLLFETISPRSLDVQDCFRSIKIHQISW